VTARQRPQNIGIALSGGGVRAAAFGLGALQALQETHGLIRGPNSARWLASVSGGSYIAGAVTLLNAGHRARYVGSNAQVPGDDVKEGTYPFAPASPEYAHLLANSNYIARKGVARLAGLFLAIVVTGIVSGFGTLVVFASVLVLGPILFGHLIHNSAGLPQAIPFPTILGEFGLGAAVASVSAALVYAMLFLADFSVKAGRVRKYTILALSMLVFTWTAEDLGRWLVHLDPSPRRVGEFVGSLGIGIGIAAAAYALVLGIALLTRSHAARSAVLALGNALLAVVGALLGVVVFAFAATGTFQWTVWVVDDDLGKGDPSTGYFLVAGIVAFVLGLAVSVQARSPYRNRLSRAFQVRRIGYKAVLIEKGKDVAFSSLVPAPEDVQFPRLAVCASANVVGGDSDIPAGHNVLPLVFRPAGMGIPTVRGAALPMLGLERAWEPVSLADVTATSGAAVSPSMGRRATGSVRGLLALLNIRLGAWLPNPLNSKVREDARKARERPPARRWSRFFAWTARPTRLIGEALGRHTSSAAEVYVTDGGHYENLGLTELIRRHCDELWVVDSAIDRPGDWSGLEQAMTAAQIESGCTFELDFSSWRPDVDGRPVSTVINGIVRYRDGREAEIHVFKIGLTAEHPAQLHEYTARDRVFPYHSLLYQVFPADRFEKYREMAFATVKLTGNSPVGAPVQ
jgi:hypothetical protein